MPKSLVLIFLLLFPGWVSAQAGQYPELPNVGIYERLDSMVPDRVPLVLSTGEAAELRALIDKPTFVAFVYYTCPGICSPLLDGVAALIDQSQLVLGQDYQVIVISIDPEDTPALAAQKKRNYLGQIGKPIDAASWVWTTTDSATVQRVTRALGFGFQKVEGEFLHTASLVAVSPEGKITRYLYPGSSQYNDRLSFLTMDVKMAVVEASRGISTPSYNKVLAYCYSFDPEGRKYVFNITKVIGTVIIFFALLFFLILVFKKKENASEQVNH